MLGKTQNAENQKTIILPLRNRPTVLPNTDLIMHGFELQEFFHSPKNVHLKDLLYTSLALETKTGA